jgi:sarcosine oxidase subunit alpha
MPSRLPPQPREWIDRTQTLDFEFEGERYRGYAGDTITSALLANGVTLLGRSFKYHRPRGAVSCAGHDANALLQSADDLNIRADTTPLAAGMRLSAVNTVGGLRQDRMRHVDRLAPLLPVGFYYKTFHRPRFLFPFWERRIRESTGLGRIDTTWNDARRARRHSHCDVLVVGAGAAGLAAAQTAAAAGARVLLVHEDPHVGGSLGYAPAADAAGAAVLRDLAEPLDPAGIELLSNSVAVGAYADGWVAVATPEGLLRVRARSVIIATGAIEQPAVFRNNDLPGVMLASAAQRLLHRYAVKPCERAVYLVANSEGYASALDLAAAGVPVAAILDLGEPSERDGLNAVAREAGIEVLGSCTPVSAEGGEQVAGIVIEQAGVHRRLDCDGILMSVGWTPNAALLYQAGARMRYLEPLGQFVPETLPAGVYAAGRVNGVMDAAGRAADGRAAAAEALHHLGFTAPDTSRPPRAAKAHSHAYPIFAHPKGKDFIDLDEDVQVKDLARAAAEGFDNIELLKRYSTTGMGPSQGKLGNMNAVRVLARINDTTIDNTGTTTARPFVQPVRLGDLAGRRLRAERLTPMHAWHVAHGAELMPAGHWLRPKRYGPGPLADSIARECLAVRNAVGLIDVSTLGKIEVFGPDAGEFLDRCYTGRLSTMKLGMTRYALAVDEAGIIVDDGVAARFAEDHFYVSTTTTSAEAIYRELQRRVAEWRLRVDLVNRTSQLAAMNIAGPLTREVLQPLTDVDLSQAAFPFLGARRGTVAGVRAWLFRVGFVGELGYEIHVRASEAQHLWSALMAAGAEHGIRPFGVEAQRQLRLEKGHLIVGQDSDGTTTPYDASMGWAVKLDKPFFVGKRSLQILERRPKRALVGFALPERYAGPVPKECHLVIHDGEIAGRVTSVGMSPSLGRVIGLAQVESVLAEAQQLEIRIDGGVHLRAEVVSTPFYDPENLRQKTAPTSAEVAA